MSQKAKCLHEHLRYVDELSTCTIRMCTPTFEMFTQSPHPTVCTTVWILGSGSNTAVKRKQLAYHTLVVLQVGASGAHALAALKDASSLQTLHLDLAGYQVCLEGLRYLLGGLHRATSLCALNLDLCGNQIGDGSGIAVADLGTAVSLRSLCLKLRRNCLGFGDAQALATLGTATTLHTLELDLSGNHLGFEGAQVNTSP